MLICLLVPVPVGACFQKRVDWDSTNGTLPPDFICTMNIEQLVMTPSHGCIPVMDYWDKILAL